MIRLGAAIALGNLVAIYGVWIFSELARHQTWFKLGEPKRPILYPTIRAASFQIWLEDWGIYLLRIHLRRLNFPRPLSIKT